MDKTEVQKLLAEATPLPWAIAPGTDRLIHTEGTDHVICAPEEVRDAALIVYAVNRLPAYEAAVRAANRVIASFEWEDDGVLPVITDDALAFGNAVNRLCAALACLRETVPA